MTVYAILDVQEIEQIYNRIHDPNILGFLRRCPESEYFRPAPAGCPPMLATEREIKHQLLMARHALRYRKK
jgi:hypothetical protein